MPASERKWLPLALEGLPFIAGFFVAALILLSLAHPAFTYLGVLCFLLSLFCLNFFRDPNRSIPSDPMYLLSPGDGVVTEVTLEQTPYFQEPARVVKIFLSVFDVHIQRSPIAGTVSNTEYKRGKFLDARDPRAAIENESHTFIIENEHQKVAVKQVAGLIARRIVPWARKGMNVGHGERIGLIRFGSQVDLFFSGQAEVLVKAGDRVVGGTSLIAINKSLGQLQAGDPAKFEIRS